MCVCVCAALFFSVSFISMSMCMILEQLYVTPDQKFKTLSISHKPLPIWLNLKHALISCSLKKELLKRDRHSRRGTGYTHKATVIYCNGKQGEKCCIEFKRLQGVCVHVDHVKCTVCVCVCVCVRSPNVPTWIVKIEIALIVETSQWFAWGLIYSTC